MRLYLDATPVIYSVEQISPYAPVVDLRLGSAGLIRIASELTRLECRVKPLRNGDNALLAEFDDFFANDISECVDLTRAVMNRAAEIRAKYGFKTPDAIHLAAACTAKCDTFLTNDHRLERFTELAIEVVEPRK